MNNAQIVQNTTVTTRVPLHLKQRWQQAAALRGVTLTDFLITAANDATSGVFDEENRIALSERDSLLLTNILARPPKVNERLARAMSEELQLMKDA